MPLAGNGARVGILGGGQLACMLALAGAPLGLRFLQLAPGQEAAEGLVETIAADFEDTHALEQLAERVDVVTFESENVPVSAVDTLAAHVRVRPSARALATAGDRWAEKDLFRQLRIPTAPFARIEDAADIDPALETVGLPAVFKTRRFGYDGRGQAVCRTREQAHAAWQQLGGVPLLCEAWVEFDRELSIVAVRSSSGAIRYYPPGENTHAAGILRTCIVPAPALDSAVRSAAEDCVRRILEEFDYVGVLALELFQRGSELLANEMAPRVHNTGHWTIEGAETSQFENHLRAILDLPLGDTAVRGHAVMLNLIGHVPSLESMLAVDGAHVHLYGKTPRPGRKLGHITALAGSADECTRRLRELRALEIPAPAPYPATSP